MEKRRFHLRLAAEKEGKRGGGVLIGLGRMAESKDEEEVVMVMMKKM